jgi:hypothetical protein
MMTIQMDMFDMTPDEKSKREVMDKLEELATGKHHRGKQGKELWDAHVKKISELFGEE